MKLFVNKKNPQESVTMRGKVNTFFIDENIRSSQQFRITQCCALGMLLCFVRINYQPYYDLLFTANRLAVQEIAVHSS